MVAWDNLNEKVAQASDERGAVLFMRRMMSAYLRGMPGVHDLRRNLMMLEATEDIRQLFGLYLKEHPDLPRQEGDSWLSDHMPLDRDIFRTPKRTVIV